MILGIIGVGVVGGALRKYLVKNTDFELRLYDPGKGHFDDLTGCNYIFISIPVMAHGDGQNIDALKAAVQRAKLAKPKSIFIRSTVLPGTNDSLGTVSMPEFLTARKADQDMEDLPIICGTHEANKELRLDLMRIFPKKEIFQMSNSEAELSKFVHNCFGAMKVTYFNMVAKMCEEVGARYSSVLHGAMMTGFIEPEHTKVPGPDGKYGYGGACFPENVMSLKFFLDSKQHFSNEAEFFDIIERLNDSYRGDYKHFLKPFEAELGS